MRISYFKIENFRSIRLAECADPPNFMVICGPNGCGKSALLEAIMCAKSLAANYGGQLHYDPAGITAGIDEFRVELHIRFTDEEREYHAQRCQPGSDPLKQEERVIISANRRTPHSYGYDGDRGCIPMLMATAADMPISFIDYFHAERHKSKQDLAGFDMKQVSQDRVIQSCSDTTAKFAGTKAYLAAMAMADCRTISADLRGGNTITPRSAPDSFERLRAFVARMFPTLTFEYVDLSTYPFRFMLRTAHGYIDIDELSSGEKEILNTFVRFERLKPKNSIVFFDEPDLHLHPDLQRRYLRELCNLSEGNQLWLTTHSPEMMMEAGPEALYTMTKSISPQVNQCVRVSTAPNVYDALTELMGTRGYISFNRKVIFIEGKESSADIAVFEKFYPGAKHNIEYIPAESSFTIKRTAEKINELLAAGLPFQEFYSIVDGDIPRRTSQELIGDRLFILPVYHIENCLIADDAILSASRILLLGDVPFATVIDVQTRLKQLLFESLHLKELTKAHFDAKLDQIAEDIRDKVFRTGTTCDVPTTVPSFATVEREVRTRLEEAVRDESWRRVCKGRTLLRALARSLDLQYDAFRNVILAQLSEPPLELQVIMDRILA